uniref:Uncharacterized protein n=1 Tax=Cacopsylla melanoneura TaxID=428564 RepID=A0A8D8Q031_9HEMI
MSQVEIGRKTLAFFFIIVLQTNKKIPSAGWSFPPVTASSVIKNSRADSRPTCYLHVKALSRLYQKHFPLRNEKANRSRDEIFFSRKAKFSFRENNRNGWLSPFLSILLSSISGTIKPLMFKFPLSNRW